MQNLKVIEVKGLRVLTTRQMAEKYQTTKQVLSHNFNYNRHRFVEGKHYIALTGQLLKEFKASQENLDNLKFAHVIYLWTEKGALLHAKSLNTDKAWEVYDYLVDFYFRAKEKKEIVTAAVNTKPTLDEMVPVTVKTEQLKDELLEKKSAESGFDIAPLFMEMLATLPVEALDEMEKAFRGGTCKAINLAAISILAEKMKRQIN